MNSKQNRKNERKTFSKAKRENEMPSNPWQTFLRLLWPIDVLWKKALLWFVLIVVVLFTLGALWVSSPENTKEYISGFFQKLITHRTLTGDTPTKAEGKEGITHSPLTLFCACEAEQTHCFIKEADCQSISQDKGCIRTHSTGMGFNVFDGIEWTKYDDHWINKKCVIK
jgi:hypothetical protein